MEAGNGNGYKKPKRTDFYLKLKLNGNLIFMSTKTKNEEPKTRT